MTVQTPTNSATARAFLATLWGADDAGNLPAVGIIAGLSNTRFRHYYAQNVDAAVADAQRLNAQGVDTYFAISMFKDFDPASNTGNRTKDKATGARSLWLDIDCGDMKAAEGRGYATQAEAYDALKAFCKAVGLPKPTYIVSSGYGLHIYWCFDRFIPAEEWREQARKLKRLTERDGLRADPSRTADIASVLRVPGTSNFKDPANPLLVTVLRDWGRADLDAFVAALDAAAPDVGRLDASPGGALELPDNLKQPPPPETPENIALVRSMLAAIDPDVGRAEWRQIVWAVLSTGWTCAEQLARDWSMTGAKWGDDENG